jgi:hypothetical protein
MRRLAIPALALLVGLAIGYMAGWMVGRTTAYEQVTGHQTYRDSAVFGPILSGDPAFKNIDVVLSKDTDRAILHGYVNTQADRDRLRTELARRFGEVRAAEMVDYVGVGKAPILP